MKHLIKLFSLALFSTALFFVSCEEDVVDDSCYDQAIYDQFDSTDCPFFNQPVCACNNVTYLNACLANKAGFTVQDSLPCVEQ